MTKTALVYFVAALGEIAGCYGFWLWQREGKSVWLVLPSVLSLALFAWFLTMVDSAAAGRAFAAYGGVYIAASVLWLWHVEGFRPDRWDITGALLSLLGTGIILFGRRL